MRISFFALLLSVPVAIIMVLGVFKLIAWLGNSMLGRNNTVDSRDRGPGLRHIIAGSAPICVIVVLLVLVKARSIRSVEVDSPSMAQAVPVIVVDQPHDTIEQDGSVLAVEQFANPHREIMQQDGGRIPVDLPLEVPVQTSKPAPDPLKSSVEPVTPDTTVDKTPSATVVDELAETPGAAAETDKVASSNVVAETSNAKTEVTGEESTAAAQSSAVTEETPATDTTEEKKPVADETATTDSEATDATVTPPVTPAAETPEQRQARLAELASHISPWIRSLLNDAQPEDTAVPADVAEAVESSDKRIVVFQLAGPIRQKYALIPLTPAFDAAFSPVTPFLANGSLESIAESLATFLKHPTETSAEASAADPEHADSTVPQPAAAPETSTPTTVALAETIGVAPVNADLTPGEQLPEAILGDITPEWINNPQPHQFVVRSDALFPEESTVAPLNRAINEMLPEHLKLYEDSLDPALQAQARLVKLELDEATSQVCVIKTFERLQSVGNEGSDKQDMRFVYALVELPESVKKAAVQTVRTSLQRDRVTGLAVIVGLAWLAICAASVSVRLWGRGGFFRKMIAIPILCLICIPLLLLAVGTGAAAAGIPGSKMPRYPWADSSKPIRIQV